MLKQEWWMYLYSGHTLISSCFVQAALSLSSLNRSGHCRDNLYRCLCRILVASRVGVMKVRLGLEAM